MTTFPKVLRDAAICQDAAEDDDFCWCPPCQRERGAFINWEKAAVIYSEAARDGITLVSPITWAWVVNPW